MGFRGGSGGSNGPHASTHATDGSDPVSPESIGAEPAGTNTTAKWNADKLQSVSVATTTPADGDVLQYDSGTSKWLPAKISSKSIAALAILTAALGAYVVTGDKIEDGAVTNAKVNTSAAIAWSKIDKTGAVPGDVGATLDHTALTNIGTNTHAQIDSHIASTSNPHSTTLAQVSNSALTESAGVITAASPLGPDGYGLKYYPKSGDGVPSQIALHWSSRLTWGGSQANVGGLMSIVGFFNDEVFNAYEVAPRKTLGLGTEGAGYHWEGDTIVRDGGNFLNIFCDSNDATAPSGIKFLYNSEQKSSPLFTILGSGSAIMGNAALATDAQRGFFYIGACAGTPTAVPDLYTGRVPLVYDSTNKLFYVYSSGWKLIGGTLTSVGLSLPSEFSVSNSPVTNSGTLTAAWASQAANKVLAGPTTGADATPTFRSLVTADFPTSGVTASTYGSSTAVPQIAVDATGRITSCSNISISLTGNALDDGKILIGNSINQAAKVTPTGDVTIDNAGNTAIGSNKVTAGKLSATTNNVVFGRTTSGAGGGEEIGISATSSASKIPVADSGGKLNLWVNTNRNAVINGDAIVFQIGSAYTLVKDAYSFTSTTFSGGPDRVAGMATGTAVSAGTYTQDTSSPIGRRATAHKFAGVTLTGSGVVYWRHRICAADAKRLNGVACVLSCLVKHDVGSNINFTLTVRKANTADTFSATTQLKTPGVTSVASGTATALTFTLTSGEMDCATGLEIEVKADAGAVTTKNFWMTELQLEEGVTASAFEIRPYATELALCQYYYERIASESVAYTNILWGMQTSTTQASGVLNFIKKRAVPTIVAASVGNFGCWSMTQGGTGHDDQCTGTSIAPDVATTTHARISWTWGTGRGAIGQICILEAWNTAAATFDIISEL